MVVTPISEKVFFFFWQGINNTLLLLKLSSNTEKFKLKT